MAEYVDEAGLAINTREPVEIRFQLWSGETAVWILHPVEAAQLGYHHDTIRVHQLAEGDYRNPPPDIRLKLSGDVFSIRVEGETDGR